MIKHKAPTWVPNGGGGEPLQVLMFLRCQFCFGARRRTGMFAHSLSHEANHTLDGRNPAPLRNHGKPCALVCHRGIIIPRLLRCEMDFVHSIGILPHEVVHESAETLLRAKQNGGLPIRTERYQRKSLRNPRQGNRIAMRNSREYSAGACPTTWILGSKDTT